MEPIVSSETSAIRTQMPGNYPKRNKLHLEHGESLKTRIPYSFLSPISTLNPSPVPEICCSDDVSINLLKRHVI